MPVYKRDPHLDADYYVSGTTVRRSVRREPEPETRRVPNNREELFPSRRDPQTQRGTQTRRGTQTQRGSQTRREPQTQRRPARPQEPLRDTRSRQERRRAEPARAYYSPEPEAQRLTRAQVNHRTVQQHAWQRAEQERRRREEELQRQREEAAEQSRRRQQRVHTLFAFMGLIVVLALAGGVFSLLTRYVAIEQMTVEQRELQAKIEDQSRRLEELQVEINRQSNISAVQDYARDSLNMDYATRENTRVVQLP